MLTWARARRNARRRASAGDARRLRSAIDFRNMDRESSRRTLTNPLLNAGGTSRAGQRRHAAREPAVPLTEHDTTRDAVTWQSVPVSPHWHMRLVELVPVADENA